MIKSKYNLGEVVYIDCIGTVKGIALNGRGEVIYDIEIGKKSVYMLPEELLIKAPEPKQ
jgi:hypothetical protein